MNIPDKFTFFNQNRTLKLTNINGDFYCTLPEVDADTISSAIYDRRNVEHKLASGKWKIVADLTVAEKEPEMKFPFTFKFNGDDGTLYKVPSSDGTNLHYTFMGAIGGPYSISIKNAKEYIKEGVWIVQSVGEQEPKEEIVEPVPEYGIHIDEDSISTKSWSMSRSGPDLVIKLTSEGIDDTTAKMERLAQATENVMMVFESLQSVLNDMGLSFGSTFTYEVVEDKAEDFFEIRDGKPFCCGGD